jgi:hypothetical protein
MDPSTLLTVPGNLLIDGIGLLDRMPDAVRALLAGALLGAGLGFFERRIKPEESQYGQSFRKAALGALIAVPLLVWLLPASRMTVFVEELPPDAGLELTLFRVILGVWLVGAAFSTVRFAWGILVIRDRHKSLPELDDSRLAQRLQHWQRRLGFEGPITLMETTGDRIELLGRRHALGFPAAGRHWPANVQDVCLIQALCHMKRRHRGWRRLARWVEVIYWPLPWVARMRERLADDFLSCNDRLASSCYQDRMGYARALRQLAERTSALPGRASAPEGQAHAGLRRLLPDVSTDQFREFIEPDRLLAVGDQEPRLTDAYDKVAVFVGQAVFLAFVLTGVTLKERPPESEHDFELPFALMWKEHFHRNLELQERSQRSE